MGSTIAYSLISNTVTGDIFLVDPNEDFCSAQAQDLSDTTYHGNTSTRVRTASHKEAGQCDIIVMTAGAAQKQGESRTELIGRNLKILESAIEDCKPFRDDDILLLVANPVDIVTQFAQRFSGLPRNQVFGSVTFLDSARLRGDLAGQMGVAPSSIDAYVLGQHGETQFVAWSHASVGSIPLSEIDSEHQIDQKKMAEDSKQKAGSIMQAKGATAFGIGGVAASICESILFDQRNIRPISFWQAELGVCLSKPAVLGRYGAVRGIPIHLNEGEVKKLEHNAKSLKEVIDEAAKSHSSKQPSGKYDWFGSSDQGWFTLASRICAISVTGQQDTACFGREL